MRRASCWTNRTCFLTSALLKPHYSHVFISAIFSPRSRFVLAPVSSSGLTSRRHFRITVPGLSRGFASATRVLRSDWTTPRLIPVPAEPIRRQLLWLHVHSWSPGARDTGGRAETPEAGVHLEGFMEGHGHVTGMKASAAGQIGPPHPPATSLWALNLKVHKNR